MEKWHGETFTRDVASGLQEHVTSTSGLDMAQGWNGFGDRLSSSSNEGVGMSEVYVPSTGTLTQTLDGRTRTVNKDASGMISRIASGLGSRGADFIIGI